MDKRELKRFIISDQVSIAEAMRKMDENAGGIIFLVNEKEKLTGCLTDGDIRRFLLAGGKLEDAAFTAANKNPRVASEKEEARKLYDQKNYIVIPILGKSGKIKDLYSGEKGEERRKNRPSLQVPVVINAGGKGTRLDPYTRVIPKPLIPVGDLPIVELIMQEYQSYDCNEFHVIVNYKRELMKAYFHDNSNTYDISWYDEEEPLGTGGGLSLLRGKLHSTFFFANCDALLTSNYESILKFHKESHNVITMVCAYKNLHIPYGIVDMGKNGTIEGMKEKPVMSFLTNTGIYVVEPEVLEDVEDNVSIGFPEIIKQQMGKGRKVAVFPVNENDWMDMGQLPELEKMREKLFGE